MTDERTPLTPDEAAMILRVRGVPATFGRDVEPTLIGTGTGWSLASMSRWWLLATISEGPEGHVEVWWLNVRGIGSDSWGGDTAYWRKHRDAQHIAEVLTAAEIPVPVYAVNLGDWCRYDDRQVGAGMRRAAKAQFRTEATRAFVAAYEAARGQS
jgi:hypothetical protein